MLVPGFSNNPFKSRDDLLRAGVALLTPLEQYRSPLGARIKISTPTGTGFSETAAQLEGFARPLWFIGSILGSPDSGVDVKSWIAGLKHGTYPTSPEYWGDVASSDQRMVEMESIAYAMLIAPEAFVGGFDEETKARIVAWLRQINANTMPENNWRWFRIFVNLALTKTCHVPLEEVKNTIDTDLELLDAFYLGGGWSSDGLWGDGRKQVDYYSGSFAMQFAQLLYVRLAPEYDPERTQKYVSQAKEFASGFWRYFSTDGAAIPFGRSLTYRFAFAAFWSAAALADVTLDAPLNDPGIIKGFLLRHLRWWAKKPNMFNLDGTLSIGFTYPNMYMSEDYNSPQSVYWCLKSFVAVAIPATHPFWTCDERPHPLVTAPGLDQTAVISQPRHILCNTPEHHFLLSLGQGTQKNHKGREAKYGKSAYSSSFTFSVPIGPLLDQVAPDSALAVSIDGASWQACRDPTNLSISEITYGEEVLSTLSGTYKPYPFLDVRVRTTLISPPKAHPGWHLRVREFLWPEGDMPVDAILLSEGGFATSAEDSNDGCIYEKPVGDIGELEEIREGWWAGDGQALVVSRTGTSGVRDLSKQLLSDVPKLYGKGSVLKPHANTNLMIHRTLIPTTISEVDLKTSSEQKSESLRDSGQVRLAQVTGVFAVPAGPDVSLEETWSAWQNPPQGINWA